MKLTVEPVFNPEHGNLTSNTPRYVRRNVSFFLILINDKYDSLDFSSSHSYRTGKNMNSLPATIWYCFIETIHY